MKQYEHEVLVYSVEKSKDFEAMQDSLREWGKAGFGIISVIPADMHSKSLTVFMKREVEAGSISENEAA